jgi:hypothetical protein
MNIYIFFWGALGQAEHQAFLKKLPKSPKLDIPFYHFKIDIENVVINNTKKLIYLNVQKKLCYIKIIFSD